METTLLSDLEKFFLVKATKGNTSVMTTIKCSMVKANSSMSNEGKIVLQVTWSPTATDKFQQRTAHDFAEFLTGVLQDTYIENNNFLETKLLSVNDGSLAWVLYIDVLVLANEGNILDAASLSIYLALASLNPPDSLRAHLKGETLIKNEMIPIYVTSHKVGHSYLVDPSREEEACSLANVSMALLQDCTCINHIQEGCGSLDANSIITMSKLCTNICKVLRQNISQEL